MPAADETSSPLAVTIGPALGWHFRLLLTYAQKDLAFKKYLLLISF